MHDCGAGSYNFPTLSVLEFVQASVPKHPVLAAAQRCLCQSFGSVPRCRLSNTCCNAVLCLLAALCCARRLIVPPLLASTGLNLPLLLAQLQWAFFISAMLFLLARLHNVMVFRGPGALDMHVRLGWGLCMLRQTGLGSVHVMRGWAGLYMSVCVGWRSWLHVRP